MNEINFLPLDYLSQRRRRGQRCRQGILVGLLALTMGGWALLAHGQIMALETRTREARTRTLMLQMQARQLQSMQQELNDLHRRLTLRRELAAPISLTQAVAQIVRHIPEKTSLSHLSLVDPSPMVKSKNDAPPQPSAALSLHIGMTGLAESNRQVADLVARLSCDPLFTQVKLFYSRPVNHAAGFGREYRIEMEIPLNREYRPPVEQAQTEVAHAH